MYLELEEKRPQAAANAKVLRKLHRQNSAAETPDLQTWNPYTDVDLLIQKIFDLL